MGVGWRGCPGSSRPSAQHRQDRPLRVPCAVRTCVSACPGHAPEERGAAGASLAGRRAGGRREDEPMSTSESRKPSRSLGLKLPVACRVCHVFKIACLGLGTERTHNARASCVVLQHCVRPGLWGPCHLASTKLHNLEGRVFRILCILTCFPFPAHCPFY